ncbi:hypothetical protein OXT66_05785 [Lentilactobacillus senioris]|uniref:hypothetical protein n=1 Tax=Lentilactobacillus senioris TaxID=931534 RepID=UPI002281CE07|nr:hypothetical protein [Lentilactobacillus senioris]MCY9807060.1 hypothetical protein [Lentilactobacillus senioris]
MARNAWDQNHIKKLKRKLILDPDTNEVLNLSECSVEFDIAKTTMRRRIIELRKVGELPKIDKRNQFDEYNRPYSDSELKSISQMFEYGCSNEEVAQRFNRTIKGISFLRSKLIHQNKINYVCQPWSDDEDRWLLDHIELDANNIVSNTQEIVKRSERSKNAIEHRIHKLRVAGKIPSTTKRGASDPGIKRWLDSEKEINQWIFSN